MDLLRKMQKTFRREKWIFLLLNFLFIFEGGIYSAYLGFCTDCTCRVLSAGDICLPLSHTKQRPGISNFKHLTSIWILLLMFVPKMAI